jgi:GNAT superfamily N-acetyltransferase
MISIRPATIEDVSIIRFLAIATWWPHYRPILKSEQIDYMLETMYAEEVLRNIIKSKEQVFLLLLEEDKPVAFSAHALRADMDEIHKLHKLYCHPDYQGKNYGKLLLQEVERLVIEKGKDILELNVNKYNPAKLFYERMGFEVVYEEDIPIGTFWMNDFVMRKILC